MPLTLKDRRFVIASLFLPQGTVYYDDDSRSTVTEDSEEPKAVNKTVPPGPPNAPTAQRPSVVFSIVDELTKVGSLAIISPCDFLTTIFESLGHNADADSLARCGR